MSEGQKHPRDLRDRLGEALRRAKFGMIRPLWHDLHEHMKEQYREHADQLLISSRHCGVRIDLSEHP